MKNSIIFFSLFLLSLTTALAISEGDFGYGNFGEGLFGVASDASTARNESVQITAATPVKIEEANNTDTEIEFNVNTNTIGSVLVVKSAIAPENSTAPESKSSIGKFITINVGSDISDNLNYSIIAVSYLDSEVSGLNEDTLRLYKWNGSDWIVFDGAGIGWVDTASNKIYANTTSFSTWAGFGSPAPSTSSGSSGGGGGGGGGGAPYYNGLKSGSKTTNMLLGSTFGFEIKGKRYYLTLVDVDVSKATIVIAQGTTLTLQEGTSNGLDIDKDGKDDFYVRLENAKLTRPKSATFRFSILAEVTTGGGSRYIEPTETPDDELPTFDGSSTPSTTETPEEQPITPKKSYVGMVIAYGIITLGVIGGVFLYMKKKAKAGKKKEE